jgi:hypothetical protein
MVPELQFRKLEKSISLAFAHAAPEDRAGNGESATPAPVFSVTARLYSDGTAITTAAPGKTACGQQSLV